MLKILHFSDAHIDMANFGRHDPVSGLPLRVMDFLNSLDEIIESAITENVDLVIFAGDTYKDRSPAPTFQREWGKRIMRLSHAKIPAILLTGNHDMSPALNRAHAIHEFETLDVPYIHVVSKPAILVPADLNGLPIQVIALPWVFRSSRMAALDVSAEKSVDLMEDLETNLTHFVQASLEHKVKKDLPVILTAHASIAGAEIGTERTIMLGKDLVLSPGLVKDPRLSYVALGHIHKAQDLNKGHQPPVIYPGSIERVDFGEAEDKKFFVIAQVEFGKDTVVRWCELKHIRTFIDLSVELIGDQDVNQKIQAVLPSSERLEGAIVRLVINYPREIEKMIDESSLRALLDPAFEFHLVKRPQINSRIRIPEGRETSSLMPIELLEIYWKEIHLENDTIEKLTPLSKQIIDTVESGKQD
ncbi:MAG: exonuclease SbcCD subunit D [Anaerolineaceae bacterium]|nr:exonuclease SbcCD subunit D [Anaerolineaceae bacterium]